VRVCGRRGRARVTRRRASSASVRVRSVGAWMARAGREAAAASGGASTVDGPALGMGGKKRAREASDALGDALGEGTLDETTGSVLKNLIEMRHGAIHANASGKAAKRENKGSASEVRKQGERARARDASPSLSSGDSTEWDVKFEGQCFGTWSQGEIDRLRSIVERWAAEHGLSEQFAKGNYDFLFNRRQKQGGRGAKVPLSERRAFIEVARDMKTRNAKQVYGWILRNMDLKSASGKWTPEETEALLKHYANLGKKWSKIAQLVGRPASACRDKWRLAKGGKKKCVGRWSEEETEKLVTLVNKFFEARGTKAGCGPGSGNEHLNLLDNINWVTISEKLGTRNEQACLQRWYQIAPSMTGTGQWSPEQDSEMLRNILAQAPKSIQDVKWATVVKKRNLSQIMRRWRLLSGKIRDCINAPFYEVVLAVAKNVGDEEIIKSAEALAASTQVA